MTSGTANPDSKPGLVPIRLVFDMLGQYVHYDAYTEEGGWPQQVGWLKWKDSDAGPVILMIEVEAPYRRKGLATKMLQVLEIMTGKRAIHTECTRMGEAWLRGIGRGDEIPAEDDA